MKLLDFVTDQARLDACCAAWRAAGQFAFDTEFIRDDTYDAALCLIQVAAGDEVTLIDPTADIDLAPFWALVTDPAVVTIVHAGKEDFDVCLRACGQPPQNVFDVQIAAGFVGAGYPLSLSRLVDHFLHRRIAKGMTLTDWLRRPLTEEQVRYAIEDVKYLPRIYPLQCAQIERLGRAAWVREEMARFESAEFYRPPVQDRLFKLKGSRRLDPLGLIVLERLVAWRDAWARERNRPIRALIRDDILVEIARRRPRRASDLEVMRGFPQARNPKVIAEILAIISAAQATPRDQWPEAFEPPDDTPMTKATLDFVSAVTRAICHEEHISHEMIGTTQRLRDLLDYLQYGRETPPALLTGWRKEFIGERLVDLLQGRAELHLSDWPRNPRITIVRREAAPRAGDAK